MGDWGDYGSANPFTTLTREPTSTFFHPTASPTVNKGLEEAAETDTFFF